MPKKYSEEEVAEAMVVLAANHNDYKKTSEQLGIGVTTLVRWSGDARDDSVPDLVEGVIKHLLTNIPDKMTGHDWAVTVGILLDKYLIFTGGPTARTENINTNSVSNLNDREYNEQLRSAEEAVRRLSGGAGKT